MLWPNLSDCAKVRLFYSLSSTTFESNVLRAFCTATEVGRRFTFGGDRLKLLAAKCYFVIVSTIIGSARKDGRSLILTFKSTAV